MGPDQTDALLKSIPIPLVLVGSDHRILSINPAAETLFGAAARGRAYVTVLRHPALQHCTETALATGAPQTADYISRDVPSDITFRVTATPAADGVMLAFTDISTLQAAGTMRRDFVANVSHELRSPLTAMLGFIETLRGPARDDPDARDRFLAIMQSEASRMSRLIQDLLSLSRVEDNERLRPSGQIDLTEALSTALARLEKIAADAGAKIAVTGRDRRLPVQGDPDQLVQVFTNLIENAIKYGGKSVQVSLFEIERDPDLRAPAIRVDVADNGPGIDPLHLPRLTERFYRVDGHRSREMGGTGLGLAIVKHIVSRHRGRLKIESVPGQGSCFSVVLPRAE